MGATLVSDRIYQAIVGGSGFFQHGHTYIGHATACAAALEVQRVIADDHLLPNVQARGEQLRGQLREHYAQHPHIGDVRGRGLFVGVELVQDRATKAPFDAKLKLHAAIRREAFARGLMVYPMGGTVDGKSGDHVLLAPPFICTARDIDEIVNRLTDAIDGALAAI
jgi:adenosylmethionine-8-amino-7-oxononanoate aminotransferase